MVGQFDGAILFTDWESEEDFLLTSKRLTLHQQKILARLLPAALSELSHWMVGIPQEASAQCNILEGGSLAFGQALEFVDGCNGGAGGPLRVCACGAERRGDQDTRGAFLFPLRPRFWAVTPLCRELSGPGSAVQALRLDLILRNGSGKNGPG